MKLRAATHRWPFYRRDDYFADPRFAMPRSLRFIATMGMPVDDQGVNYCVQRQRRVRGTRVLSMLDLLQERGFSKEQAYVLCSVAVDLRINNLVDVP